MIENFISVSLRGLFLDIFNNPFKEKIKGL